MSESDYLAVGRRAAIRPFAPADAEEFTGRARESRDLHSPWLFPPGDARAYAAYAGRLIDDPTKAGFLVCERGGGDGPDGGTGAESRDSSTSTTSSGARSAAARSDTGSSPTRRDAA